MNWLMDDNIVEKIDGLPVLRCNDVELFFEGGIPADPYTVWIPRRYQTCWQLSAHGPSVAMRSNPYSMDSLIRKNLNNVRRVCSSLTVSEGVNLDMFSDIRVLVETVVKYASLHHVSFTDGPPTMPFTNLEISAFKLLCHEYCPREQISLSCPTSLHVNKQESCAFHTFCTELPEAASKFCAEHHIIAARFYSSLSGADKDFFAGRNHGRNSYNSWKETDSQPVVTRRPVDTTLLSTIANLHRLYEQKIV
ncbi:hypothetical protein E8E13_005012 [Curvularia kusanoi]|uniref:Uncharacterized protein n=1 Tax=Curvularia kusanoi TaxID=90978 RepID=A0A9P4TA86_CURKU|nr:hypothetical protein E8E13_005012 [Curvularia kusanoi]